MLELVESLADYGADYRNFLRELLLHLREVLIVKLAPLGSPLLAGILPEETERLRALAQALSQEDLLRGLDLLTEAESEFRNVTDPRVALDLVLLKLVEMRRLVPFVELVARVERLLGGKPAEAVPAAPRALPQPRPPAAPTPARVREDAPSEVAPASPAASGPAEALLASMLGLCQTRPTLAAPLRAAGVRFEGDTLRARAAARFRRAGGCPRRRLQGARGEGRRQERPAAIRGRVCPASAAAAAVTPEVARKQQLREEAEKEPAVQEALDLFDGRVVDVREAKPGREDA